jgi:serine/threonine protein kinase
MQMHARGYTHGDIKPANILLSKAQAGERKVHYKLADVGGAYPLNGVPGMLAQLLIHLHEADMHGMWSCRFYGMLRFLFPTDAVGRELGHFRVCPSLKTVPSRTALHTRQEILMMLLYPAGPLSATAQYETDMKYFSC